MRRLVLNLMLVLALAVGLAPASWSIGQPVVAAAQGTGTPPSVPTEPKSPVHMQEIPAEIQAQFAGGIPVEEFVARAGYVPRALEGIVKGSALMIIEMKGDPLAVAYAAQKQAGQSTSASTLDAMRAELEAAQADVQMQMEKLGAQVISHYTAAYNGMQALVPLAQLNAIRALPGVTAVHRAPIYTPSLRASVPLIRVPEVWNDLGVDGAGVDIVVIDTGIDYTHAVFEGPGTVQAYELNNPDLIEPGTFPTAKVVGGYDFAGTNYDANGDVGSPIPNPDPDPLDEHYHGTHVASIAAGIAAGQVMTGVAPGASLIALKVFGAAEGASTSLVVDALDWATLEYLYDPKPTVINMSLGSPFGTGGADEPDVVATQNAVDLGIVVAAASGNDGDASYVTSAPASADGAISVAASTTGYVTGPTVDVVATSYMTQTNIIYNPSSFDAGGHFETAITAPLGYAGALPGATDALLCSIDGITAGSLSGKIALISRGSCNFSLKVNNAASLGAVAALIYNNTTGIIGMIGTPVTIPAGSLQMEDGLNLIPADGEMTVVSAETDVTSVADPYTAADTIASFSSRGPRSQDSFLKPEITAPGVAIFAANAGTGDEGQSLSGTSMATPHIAGVAALMLSASATSTPGQVKARMMNTAVDLADGASIPLSGAGRVDAYRTVSTTVMAISDPDLVSADFGVIFADTDLVTMTKPVTFDNAGATSVTYDVAAALQAGSIITGASVMVDPVQVTVPAASSEMVTLTLALDVTQIPVDMGVGEALEEIYGFVTFSPTVAPLTNTVRVPFYTVPRPYAELDVTANATLFDPSSDTVTVAMTHTGPISSSLWMFPALVQNAMPNPAMAGPGDVRMFGLDYGGGSPYGDIIVAGIDAWDYWSAPQDNLAEFDLYLDYDQDGTYDYMDFNSDYGAIVNGTPDNEWMVFQVDLATNILYLASPYYIYTDYDASYMEWYLPAPWQDLGPDNSDFMYQLMSSDMGGEMTTPPGVFDYMRSPFAWMISNDPGPADPTASATVVISDLGGYQQSMPEGVMLVDYNGDPRNMAGGQAYFLPVVLTGAYLQVAHLAPFAMGASSAVTVTLNGMPALTDFAYGDSTGYVALAPGMYEVAVTPMGSATAAITGSLDLITDTYQTAIAVGDGVNQPLSLTVLMDDLVAPPPGKFKARLGNLAPFAGGAGSTVDIRLQDGTLLVGDLAYGDVTNYMELDAGALDVKITTPGGMTTLIDPAPVTVPPGAVVSAFVTGDETNAPLGAFVLPAGSPGGFVPLTTYVIHFPLIYKNGTP